jgi:hypothetical protein
VITVAAIGDLLAAAMTTLLLHAKNDTRFRGATRFAEKPQASNGIPLVVRFGLARLASIGNVNFGGLNAFV